MATVALTGATGFLGNYLLCALTRAGHHVRALTRREQAPLEGVNWISGNLTDTPALTEMIDGADVIIHVAGITKAVQSKDFMAINAEATSHLAELAAQKNASPRFILISSLAAREPHLSPYAASKKAGEDAVLAYRDRLDPVILRPTAIYGPGDQEMADVFRTAARGFLPVPEPDQRLTLIHVADAARAALNALQAPSQTYDVHDGYAPGYTWAEINTTLQALLRRPIRLLAVPRSILRLAGCAGGLKARLTGRPVMLTRAKVAELAHPDWSCAPLALPGFAPQYALNAGLAETLDDLGLTKAVVK